MRKTGFVISLLLALSFSSNAQITKIFPDSTGAWRIVDYERYFLMNHDTLINGSEYHFLYIGFPDINDTIWADKFGAYRIDSLKVYFRNFINDSLSDDEFLLYDFGISIGDTFTLTHCYWGACDTTGGQRYRMKLSTIDSVLISGEWLKRWNFENICCPFVAPFGLVWYEGIGSDVGFFHKEEMISIDMQLGCFHSNGIDYVFELGSASSCYAVGMSEKTKIQNIKIYPNPSDGNFTLEYSDFINSNIIITDITGKIIYQKNSFLEKTEIILNEKPGIYFLVIETENEVITRKIVLVK